MKHIYVQHPDGPYLCLDSLALFGELFPDGTIVVILVT